MVQYKLISFRYTYLKRMKLSEIETVAKIRNTVIM